MTLSESPWMCSGLTAKSGNLRRNSYSSALSSRCSAQASSWHSQSSSICLAEGSRRSCSLFDSRKTRLFQATLRARVWLPTSLLPQRGLVVDEAVALVGGMSVRVASSDSNGSPPISPQTGQLHVAAQAAAEATTTGVVNLAFHPDTLLISQWSHAESQAAFVLTARRSSARACCWAARSSDRGNAHAQQSSVLLTRIGVLL